MNDVICELRRYVYEEIYSPISRVDYKCEQDLKMEDPPKDTDEYFGKINGKVHFFDGSWLKFREIISISYDPILDRIVMDKRDYRYNYHDDKSQRRFAYHSGPPEKCYKNLKSYPHHKHIGDNKNNFTEGNENITLEDVLNEIGADLDERA